MLKFFPNRQNNFFAKIIIILVLCSFLGTSLGLNYCHAAAAAPYAAGPGVLAALSRIYQPPVLAGIKFYPDNPLKFDFIINKGDSSAGRQELRAEATKLINYFLAALAIPEDELWVNLSPYEPQRIIPQAVGQTDLGKDLLYQDYFLKQLSASLTYPETEQGKKYWDEINNPVGARHASPAMTGGARPSPTSTFNKIWIVPDKTVVYEKADRALIGESSLKVMMEEDYLACRQAGLAMQKNSGVGANDHSPAINAFKTHILPLIEKDVNRGRNFAPLRQICSSVILATWFKLRLKAQISRALSSDKTSPLGQFLDQEKTKGIEANDPDIKEKIYNRYLEAFKTGVYNYVKRDRVETHGGASFGKITRRQYFSGGVQVDYRETLTPAPLTAYSDSPALHDGANIVVTSELSAVTKDGSAANPGSSAGPAEDIVKDARYYDPQEVLNHPKVKEARANGRLRIEGEEALAHPGEVAAPVEGYLGYVYDIMCAFFGKNIDQIMQNFYQVTKDGNGRLTGGNTVGIDSLYGAAQGYAEALLTKFGVSKEAIVTFHRERNPNLLRTEAGEKIASDPGRKVSFVEGGTMDKSLEILNAAEGKLRMSVAGCDTDGDRTSAMAFRKSTAAEFQATGRHAQAQYLDPNAYFSVLILNMAKKAVAMGMPLVVVRSSVSSMWVDQVIDRWRGGDKTDSELAALAKGSGPQAQAAQEALKYRELILTPGVLPVPGYETGKNNELNGTTYITIRDDKIPLFTDGFTTYPTEVGFKFVAEAMLNALDPRATMMLGGRKVRLVMGYEESAGFAFGVDVPQPDGTYKRYLIPDKDGLTATMLMLCLQAESGKMLDELYAEARQNYGPEPLNERMDTAAPSQMKIQMINGLIEIAQGKTNMHPMVLKTGKELLGFMEENCPHLHIGGILFDRFNIVGIDQDGMPMTVRIRMSGTEPIDKEYITAGTPEKLAALKAKLEAWINACSLNEISQVKNLYSLLDVLAVVDIHGDTNDSQTGRPQALPVRRAIIDAILAHLDQILANRNMSLSDIGTVTGDVFTPGRVLQHYLSEHGPLNTQYLGERSRNRIEYSIHDVMEEVVKRHQNGHEPAAASVQPPAPSQEPHSGATLVKRVPKGSEPAAATAQDGTAPSVLAVALQDPSGETFSSEDAEYAFNLAKQVLRESRRRTDNKPRLLLGTLPANVFADESEDDPVAVRFNEDVVPLLTEQGAGATFVVIPGLKERLHKSSPNSAVILNFAMLTGKYGERNLIVMDEEDYQFIADTKDLLPGYPWYQAIKEGINHCLYLTRHPVEQYQGEAESHHPTRTLRYYMETLRRYNFLVHESEQLQQEYKDGVLGTDKNVPHGGRPPQSMNDVIYLPPTPENIARLKAEGKLVDTDPAGIIKVDAMEFSRKDPKKREAELAEAKEIVEEVGGTVGIMKFAGGMATRFGAVVKAKFKAFIMECIPRSFIEISYACLRWLKKNIGLNMEIVNMHTLYTYQDVETELSARRHFGLDPKDISASHGGGLNTRYVPRKKDFRNYVNIQIAGLRQQIAVIQAKRKNRTLLPQDSENERAMLESIESLKDNLKACLAWIDQVGEGKVYQGDSPMDSLNVRGHLDMADAMILDADGCRRPLLGMLKRHAIFVQGANIDNNTARPDPRMLKAFFKACVKTSVVPGMQVEVNQKYQGDVGGAPALVSIDNGKTFKLKVVEEFCFSSGKGIKSDESTPVDKRTGEPDYQTTFKHSDPDSPDYIPVFNAATYWLLGPKLLLLYGIINGEQWQRFEEAFIAWARADKDTRRAARDKVFRIVDEFAAIYERMTDKELREKQRQFSESGKAPVYTAIKMVKNSRAGRTVPVVQMERLFGDLADLLGTAQFVETDRRQRFYPVKEQSMIGKIAKVLREVLADVTDWLEVAYTKRKSLNILDDIQHSGTQKIRFGSAQSREYRSIEQARKLVEAGEAVVAKETDLDENETIFLRLQYERHNLLHDTGLPVTVLPDGQLMFDTDMPVRGTTREITGAYYYGGACLDEEQRDIRNRYGLRFDMLSVPVGSRTGLLTNSGNHPLYLQAANGPVDVYINSHEQRSLVRLAQHERLIIPPAAQFSFNNTGPDNLVVTWWTSDRAQLLESSKDEPDVTGLDHKTTPITRYSPLGTDTWEPLYNAFRQTTMPQELLFLTETNKHLEFAQKPPKASSAAGTTYHDAYHDAYHEKRKQETAQRRDEIKTASARHFFSSKRSALSDSQREILDLSDYMQAQLRLKPLEDSGKAALKQQFIAGLDRIEELIAHENIDELPLGYIFRNLKIVETEYPDITVRHRALRTLETLLQRLIKESESLDPKTIPQIFACLFTLMVESGQSAAEAGYLESVSEAQKNNCQFEMKRYSEFRRKLFQTIETLFKRDEFAPLYADIEDDILPLIRLAAEFEAHSAIRQYLIRTAYDDLDNKVGTRADLATADGRLARQMITKIYKLKYRAFGTSGVREREGMGFDPNTVVLTTDSVSDFLTNKCRFKNPGELSNKVVVLGRDTREGSDRDLWVGVMALLEAGYKVIAFAHPIPTGALVHYALNEVGPDLAAIINFTPSHNPNPWHGERVSLGEGTPAAVTFTNLVSRMVNERLMIADEDEDLSQQWGINWNKWVDGKNRPFGGSGQGGAAPGAAENEGGINLKAYKHLQIKKSEAGQEIPTTIPAAGPIPLNFDPNNFGGFKPQILAMEEIKDLRQMMGIPISPQ